MDMDEETLRQLVEEEQKLIGETDEVREQALTNLRDWIQNNPKIIKCPTDDTFLLAFLRVKKFNIMKSRQMITNFIKAVQSDQHLNNKCDITDPAIEAVYSTKCLFVSPFRDKKGRNVVIGKVGALDLSTATETGILQTQACTNWAVMRDPVTQVTGCVHVSDSAGLQAGHVALFNPGHWIRGIRVAEQAIPLRHKEVHFINMNPVGKAFVNFVLGLLSKKMQSRVFFHDSLEDLHRMVSPELLPAEYGGKIPAADMAAMWKEKMLPLRDTMMDTATIRMIEDESEEEDMGVGSFRKLTID